MLLGQRGDELLAEKTGMTLRIFSDPSYVMPGRDHVVLLYPFWGRRPEDPRDPNSTRFDTYVREGRQLFELVPIEAADVAVFPMDWQHVATTPTARTRAAEFVERAQARGKPVVFFYWSDSSAKLPFDDVWVFRTSLERSHRLPTEFAMPAWSEDFINVHLGGALPVRRKGKKPIVGFCGYAPRPPSRRTQRVYQRLRHVLARGKWLLTSRGHEPRPYPIMRRRALALLAQSDRVQTNFIIRDQFLAGALSAPGAIDYGKLQAARREFVMNMVESDYALCARGAGNFSYRFYEALSCGRIPIFIDTDCVLPYQTEINWKDYCVWVDEREVEHIAEIVEAHYASLSDHAFIDLQRACRRIWEQYICPTGFFTNFHKHFRQ